MIISLKTVFVPRLVIAGHDVNGVW